MTGTIQGRDALISFQGGSGFLLFGCASELIVNIETELKSIKTKGNGVWKKQAQQALGYTITLNGLVVYTPNIGAWDLLANQMQFININFRIILPSGSDVRRLEGEAIIQSAQLSITPNDLVKANFNLPGNGELMVYNNDGVCVAVINDAILDAPGGSRKLTFDANSDTAYIHYQLLLTSSNAVLDESNVYSPDFEAAILSFANNHLLYVSATPYCANGVAGAVFNKSF